MKNIINGLILGLKEVIAGQLIIPNQDDFIFREAGNPLLIGNDIILLYTMNSKVGYAEQWLYYSYCNKYDLKHWTHMGKLNIKHMMEDPYLMLKNNVFILKAEDRKKPDKFSICQYNSTDWNYKTNKGTWDFKGTIYAHPGGAMYSPLFDFESGKEFNFAEERYSDGYKDINIVNADNKNNPRTVLIHYTDDLNVVVTDYIYLISNKYVQFAHGLYHRGKSDERWVHFIAISDNLLSGWKIKPQLIKPIGIVPILIDNVWCYLVEGLGGLYLGTPKYTLSGEDMKPKNLNFDKNTNLLSCDNILEATFNAYATGKNGAEYNPQNLNNGAFPYNLISRGDDFDRVNGRIVFTRIQSKFHLDETQEYWIISTVKGRTYDSDKIKVKRGDVIIPILGCMNPKASNYDPSATEDDGSCIFLEVPFDKVKVNTSLDNIKTFVKILENATTGITKEVNIIEAEVNKTS